LKDNEELKFNGETIEENINTTYKDALYDKLIISDKEDTKYDEAFYTSAQSFGDYYYLTFKVVDATPDKKLTYTSDEETEIDKEKSKELYDSLFELLKKDDLTDTYISSKITDGLKDAKRKIYFDNLEIAYMAKNSDYSKNHSSAPKDDVIASIKIDGNEHFIYASEMYNYLERKDGITSAMSMISKKVIKDSDEFKNISEEDTKQYYKILDNVLTNFSADGLSSYGYPAKIGKYNFLKLYFHETDVDSIVNDTYKINAASAKLLNNYASDSLESFLLDYASSAYDSYFKTSSNLITVYVDMDEDGNPDKEFDWSKECKLDDQTKTYEDAAKELLQKVETLALSKSGEHKSAITSIIDEYKKSSRFTNGHDKEIVDEEYDPTKPETVWAKYRRIGLYIKTTELKDITNSSELADVDYALKQRLNTLYSEKMIGTSAPTEYLDYQNVIKTDDGFNTILLTSLTAKDSAKFEESDDLNGIYKGLKYYYNEGYYTVENMYSNTDKLSLNQVKAYLLEYVTSSTTNTIPSKILTVINNYFSPVYTRYTSEASQRLVLLLFLENKTNATFSFGNEAIKYSNDKEVKYEEKLQEIVSINSRAADSYNIKSYTTFAGETLQNDTYDELSDVYTNWFEALKNYMKK
jgi:hypothetical protein